MAHYQLHKIGFLPFGGGFGGMQVGKRFVTSLPQTQLLIYKRGVDGEAQIRIQNHHQRTSVTYMTRFKSPFNGTKEEEEILLIHVASSLSTKESWP